MDWRPIETAPKDKFVLVWIESGDGDGLYEVARYDASGEQFAGGQYGPFVWASQTSGVGIWAKDIVTRWMPLPLPPA